MRPDWEEEKRRMEPAAVHTVVAAALATLFTAAAVVMRAVLLPGVRDGETGRFSVDYGMVAFFALAAVLIGVSCIFCRRGRAEVSGMSTIPLSLTALLSGGIIAAVSLKDAFIGFRGIEGKAISVLYWLTVLFGIVGGVVLMVWGLQTLTGHRTFAGMRTWSTLAPVLWSWFRLAGYELSYASVVGFSDSVCEFATVIFEMLFLFRLARFISGVGELHPRMLLFLSFAAALFGLGESLSVAVFYLMGDGEAFRAVGMIGLSDFAVGLLGLVFGWCQITGGKPSAPPTAQEREDIAADATAADAVLPLVLTDDGEDEPDGEEKTVEEEKDAGED